MMRNLEIWQKTLGIFKFLHKFLVIIIHLIMYIFKFSFLQSSKQIYEIYYEFRKKEFL
jgi:hypothetical protein